MSNVLAAEYVTVREAAQALKVSASTIWRWIDQGTLPAYRVGARKVRIRASDLDRLITPARHSPSNSDAELQRMREELSRPLTKEQQEYALAVMDETERLERELGIADQGPSEVDSVDLLREAREERTRQLG
jgi:excisionase family DNA binding protein